MSTERIRTIDEKGVLVVVFKVTPQVPAGTFADPRATIEGPPEYWLESGVPVSLSGDGFQVVSTGQRLRRA